MQKSFLFLLLVCFCLAPIRHDDLPDAKSSLRKESKGQKQSGHKRPSDGTPLKKVLDLRHAGDPASHRAGLKPNAWKPWQKGFKRQGNVFICDNGTDAQVQRGVSQAVILNQTKPEPIVAVAWSKAEDDVNDAISPFSQRVTSPSYWMVQIVSCHQGVRPTDFDPDIWYHWHSDSNHKLGDTAALFGQSPKGGGGKGYNISCIFLEPIRDQVAYEVWFKSTHPSYPTPFTASQIEQTTVVHEVGWVFGCDISDGGIMGIPAKDPALNFTPLSIKKIRSLYHIGIP